MALLTIPAHDAGRAAPERAAGVEPVRRGEPATSMTAPVRTIVLAEATSVPGERDVAVEEAVEVSYGGVPFAVMMMTPADWEDFAFGFSLTEGVIEAAGDIRGVEVSRKPGGVALLVDLAPHRLHAHFARRRLMTGRTGCGVCGVEDLASLPRARAPVASPAPPPAPAAIARALEALEAGQALHHRTGAVHAAAFADRDGALLALREDVGRHNALDKLIGALLRADIGPGEGFLVITSRCSFEMVEKAGAFGARAIVAVSAPTTLALDRARALGLTIVGIARRDAMTLFHDAAR